MNFSFILVPTWPPLAWLGRCRTGSDVVEILHGSWVETTDEWFCEAIWAGGFERGDFDNTDIIAGSGGRSREGQVVFVSSGSTVDRLQSLSTTDGVLVSNSICCLLSVARGSLDPSYPHYHRDISSINNGLSSYKRHLNSSAGLVELTYFDNLVWNGHEFARKPKEETAPEFASFEQYRDFLESTMAEFMQNASASARQHRFRPLVLLSKGYDSSTIAAIIRKLGACPEALSIDVDRDGLDDSGATIARHLNMRCTVMRRDAWRSLNRPEVPFMAGSPGCSDVLLAAFEPKLSGTVLFSGYGGGMVWAKDSKLSHVGLARNDGSGRALTEYRLWANFIHCPVPYWGARRGRELVAISQSREMRAWDVPGNYSRPICRRIVEEAGVPREAFGIYKCGVSEQLYRPETFLTPAARQDYIEWLRENRVAWFRRGRVPPIQIIARVVDAMLSLMSWSLSWLAHCALKRRPFGLARKLCLKCVGKLQSIQIGTEAPLYLRRYTYAWGVEHGKKRYPQS